MKRYCRAGFTGLAIVLLSGCSSRETIVERPPIIVTKRIEQPVAVPLHVLLPPLPTTYRAQLEASASRTEKLRAMLADGLLWEAYSRQLKAVLDAYMAAPSPAPPEPQK